MTFAGQGPASNACPRLERERKEMYASIRRYRMGAGSMDDAMHLADTELADRLSAEPGFIDYQAMDTGDGTITSVTIFEDEEQCLRSNDMAAEFVREHLSDFQVERLDTFGGEVMVSRAAERVLEPAHH
jgi:hypothetical protein